MNVKERKHAIVAVTYKDGKILCVRRKLSKSGKMSGKWLFPGCFRGNSEDNVQALKAIFKNHVYCGNHITDALYTDHPDFDIELHFYSCWVDTDVTLSKSEQYDAQEWVREDELSMFNNWPKCYADVLCNLRLINSHLCSSVRYNLFVKYNHVNYLSCHESDAKYGTEKHDINNVLVACCSDKTQYEQAINAGKYQITSIREENEEPISVDCLVLYSPECGYCMFTVNSTYVKPSDLKSSCILSYELGKEYANSRILSIAAATINASANTMPFILCFENA